MGFLRGLLYDCDKLYADRNLDARHADRWWRKLDEWWPLLSRDMRAMLDARDAKSPTYVAGIVSCVGTADRCRKLGRIMVDEFVQSGRDGVFVHLSRNREAHGPAEQFRLAVGFTGRDREQAGVEG